MEKYVKQIDTSRYGDYRIIDNYFCQESPFKRKNYTRVLCESLFLIQHQPMKKYYFIM